MKHPHSPSKSEDFQLSFSSSRLLKDEILCLLEKLHFLLLNLKLWNFSCKNFFLDLDLDVKSWFKIKFILIYGFHMVFHCKVRDFVIQFLNSDFKLSLGNQESPGISVSNFSLSNFFWSRFLFNKTKTLYVKSFQLNHCAKASGRVSKVRMLSSIKREASRESLRSEGGRTHLLLHNVGKTIQR